MLPNIPVKNCCGCTACYSICPKNAIEMIPDSEGFEYPVIDKARCVECGMCVQACPIENPPALSCKYEAEVVARNRSFDVLCESTSGGFIDALYRYVVVELGGFGVGVSYDDEFMPVHTITNDYETATGFRNSKYAQSKLADTFSDMKILLENEKTVLFVGTPCQVAGLKTFLRKDYENLFTVDLVCRSIPSPKLWREYIKWQETRHKSRVKKITCRKKTYGYHSGTLEIEFENSKKYSGSNRVDYYMKSFHKDICSRPSCYDCKFKTKHRSSDFTVFDCWEPQKVALEKLVDDDRGFSNVIAHSKKGKELLSKLSDIQIYSASADKMFEFTGDMESRSIERKPQRDTFYIDLEKLGFEENAKKYVSVTKKDMLIEKLKPFVYFAKKMRK